MIISTVSCRIDLNPCTVAPGFICPLSNWHSVTWRIHGVAVSLRIQNDPDGCCLFVNRKPNWWVCNVFLIKGSFREENAAHQFGKHFLEARLWAFIRASLLFSWRNRQPSIHPIKIISCQWIMYLWIYNYPWFSPSCHILNKIISWSLQRNGA